MPFTPMTAALLELDVGAHNDERFLSLFEDAPVAYHEIDRDGVVRRVNKAECQMLGIDASQILDQPVWNLVAPEQRELSRDSVRRKLTGQEPLTPFQRRYLPHGGVAMVLEIHENFIRDADGGIVGIRSVLLDITDRQHAENDLRRKAVELTEARDAALESGRLQSDLLNEVVRVTSLLTDTLLTCEQRDYVEALLALIGQSRNKTKSARV